MRDKKILFYDIETSGLDSTKHGIIQISGIIDINGEEKENFNFFVKLFSDDLIDEAALKIINIDKSDIENFESPIEVHKKLIEILSKHINKYDKLDKFYLCGYNNIKFDDQFLRTFFEKNGDKFFGSFFWSNSIDVIVLATMKLLKYRELMDNFKLKTVAQTLGVDFNVEDLHNSMNDIILTRKVFYELFKK